MDELANSIQPFEVRLTELQVIRISFPGTEYGLLWIDVEENKELRKLHDRLNNELSARFGDTPADFDGEAYHFHMTIAMGGQPVEVYRMFYNELSTPKINLQFTIKELVMFVYDEPIGPSSEYLCYKISPIGK